METLARMHRDGTSMEKQKEKNRAIGFREHAI